MYNTAGFSSAVYQKFGHTYTFFIITFTTV